MFLHRLWILFLFSAVEPVRPGIIGITSVTFDPMHDPFMYPDLWRSPQSPVRFSAIHKRALLVDLIFLPSENVCAMHTFTHTRAYTHEAYTYTWLIPHVDARMIVT